MSLAAAQRACGLLGLAFSSLDAFRPWCAEICITAVSSGEVWIWVGGWVGAWVGEPRMLLMP